MQKVLHSEYIMLCALSYCYFSKNDIGKSLTELLIDESPNLQDNKERILITNTLFKKMDYFNNWNIIEHEYAFLFKDWKILEIMDSTNNNPDESKPTGFFAIAFGKYNKKDELQKIVCAYRGSELFPINEAFKDFIETDMLIGIAKKPKQFDQGLKFYESIIEKYDYKLINLAGHSLGGGIAQYVAVMAETVLEDKAYTPDTFTINGIGVLERGFVEVQYFLKYDDDFFEEFPHAAAFEKEYSMISKVIIPYILTRCPYIKNSSELKKLPQFVQNFKYNLSSIERKFLHKSIKVTYYDSKFSDKEIDDLINFFFEKTRLFPYLKEAERVLNNFYSNKKYTKVLNYVHSKDFTASFSSHVGITLEVDKNLKIRENAVKTDFFKQLNRLSVIIEKYHMLDVFTPFLVTRAGKNSTGHYPRGNFSSEINESYVASALRKLIHLEKYIDNELLVLYHSRQRRLSSNEIEFIRESLMKTLKTSAIKHIKYSRTIYNKLECAEQECILRIWIDMLDRGVSPYKCLDINDIMVYHYV